MKRYCDSSILILYYDATGPLNVRAQTWLDAIHAAGDELVITDLTRLECRVEPLRLGNAISLAVFDNLFARRDVRRVPLTSTMFDRATLVRAAYRFAATDSIHLAAAVESGCDRFLTFDFRLRSFADIAVEVMP